MKPQELRRRMIEAGKKLGIEQAEERCQIEDNQIVAFDLGRPQLFGHTYDTFWLKVSPNELHTAYPAIVGDRNHPHMGADQVFCLGENLSMAEEYYTDGNFAGLLALSIAVIHRFSPEEFVNPPVGTFQCPDCKTIVAISEACLITFRCKRCKEELCQTTP